MFNPIPDITRTAPAFAKNPKTKVINSITDHPYLSCILLDYSLMSDISMIMTANAANDDMQYPAMTNGKTYVEQKIINPIVNIFQANLSPCFLP